MFLRSKKERVNFRIISEKYYNIYILRSTKIVSQFRNNKINNSHIAHFQHVTVLVLETRHFSVL
jgi:hypothetical protein